MNALTVVRLEREDFRADDFRTGHCSSLTFVVFYTSDGSEEKLAETLSYVPMYIYLPYMQFRRFNLEITNEVKILEACRVLGMCDMRKWLSALSYGIYWKARRSM